MGSLPLWNISQAEVVWLNAHHNMGVQKQKKKREMNQLQITKYKLRP